ncbi:hypothetical protein [Streptomyces sp. BA2]|uniref:hypothetical protein n=1 Tax=Streptomyces sp. BA2 TaxID=436595 RepID=UPI0013293822|nr:hypothetical protein [Streptomyces sp. BA2]MWA11159.1 hypothetical protein [Streptomyces sp. BA2]
MSALAATTLLTSVATADDTDPAGGSVDITDDASTVSLDEEGLFELPSSDNGEIQPRNFSSSIGGWLPGSHESSHWSDNDYTEIKFTNCTLSGAADKSLHVQLHQAIPFSLDKSLGSKRFTNCFEGSGKTSRGEWDTHVSNGDNRYFTIPKHNDSEHSRTSLKVQKVYVDTSKAD